MNKKLQEKPIIANTIETAFSKENIQSLLETLNIGTSRNINIIKEITHNPVNTSILFETPNDSCVGENPILVNAKHGQPTVDQVYNAIYQHGADCQNRIITFTAGHFLDDKFNPSADMETVKCLVDNMNRFELNINLVQMVYDSTSSTCDFEILAKPDIQPLLSTAECPSKEKFTEAEF